MNFIKLNKYSYKYNVGKHLSPTAKLGSDIKVLWTKGKKKRDAYKKKRDGQKSRLWFVGAGLFVCLSESPTPKRSSGENQRSFEEFKQPVAPFS